MTNLYNLRVQDCEAVTSLLDLFVYTEQKWCTWEKLEESIAKVDYEKLNEEELNWYVEFLVNCVMRVWRTVTPDEGLNKVKENDVGFTIYNYDWNAYRYGRQKNVDKDVTAKKVIIIDKDYLSPAEIKWLRSKCK